MEPNQPTPEQQTEDQEWAAASEQFAADKGLDPAKPADAPATPEAKPEPKKEPEAPAEPAKPEDAAAKPEAPKPPENETLEQKTEREAKEAEEAAKKEEPVADDPSVRSQRALQRELAADRKAVSQDVREKMFADVKTELTDADGDPLKTPADVMKLINPNTNKPFTAEEATIYLFQAQKYLDQQLKEVDDKVEQIAEINLTLKDEADNIRVKYGEILKNMPELAKELHADFMETLTKDEKTGLIVGAPVSLEKFYTRALRPYAEHLSKLEADAKVEAEAEVKKNTQQTRKRTQSDRGDLYATGKADTMDKEEAEWAEAAKAVYGK